MTPDADTVLPLTEEERWGLWRALNAYYDVISLARGVPGYDDGFTEEQMLVLKLRSRVQHNDGGGSSE
jgi:hypothetical protein